jgi:hypothetical protein
MAFISKMHQCISYNLFSCPGYSVTGINPLYGPAELLFGDAERSLVFVICSDNKETWQLRESTLLSMFIYIAREFCQWDNFGWA